MNGFRSMPKKEKEYPKFITSEDKDVVLDLMLDRKDEEEIVHLDYKDVSCLLNIGKINSVISGMNNISDLASNIGKILDIIHRSLPTQ